ncbi:UNVERIFIED_CONTAM: hypothetical protein IGO34_24660, partial [Salmonella enterica subsp. enterica serovar Weltevreden]
MAAWKTDGDSHASRPRTDPDADRDSGPGHGAARHPSVANVQQPTELVRGRRPQLLVGGELRFAAACVPGVAAQRPPD